MNGTLLMFFFRLGLVFLAAYLSPQFPLPGGITFPFLATGMLALLSLKKIRSWKPVFIGVGATFLFSIFNVLTSLSPEVPLIEHIKSIVYFLYLVTCSLIIANTPLFPQTSRKWVGILLLSAGFGLLFLGAVEQKTPLKRISDKYRDIAYGYGRTDNEARDIQLTGSVRPKLFTREPSHAARGVSMVFILSAVATSSLALRLGALAGIALAVPVFGSPVPAGFLGALFCGAFIPRIVQQKGLAYPYAAFMGGVGLLALVALYTTVPSFTERIDSIREGRDASTIYRTTVVWSMARSALDLNALSGVGIGAEDKLGSDAFLESRQEATINTMINNAILSVPLFTGWAGVVFFSLFAFIILLSVPPHLRLFFFMVIFCLLFSTGAIHSTQAWSAGAILYAMLNPWSTSPKKNAPSPCSPHDS